MVTVIATVTEKPPLRILGLGLGVVTPYTVLLLNLLMMQMSSIPPIGVY